MSKPKHDLAVTLDSSAAGVKSIRWKHGHLLTTSNVYLLLNLLVVPIICMAFYLKGEEVFKIQDDVSEFWMPKRSDYSYMDRYKKFWRPGSSTTNGYTLTRAREEGEGMLTAEYLRQHKSRLDKTFAATVVGEQLGPDINVTGPLPPPKNMHTLPDMYGIYERLPCDCSGLKDAALIANCNATFLPKCTTAGGVHATYYNYTNSFSSESYFLYFVEASGVADTAAVVNATAAGADKAGDWRISKTLGSADAADALLSGAGTLAAGPENVTTWNIPDLTVQLSDAVITAEDICYNPLYPYVIPCVFFTVQHCFGESESFMNSAGLEWYRGRVIDTLGASCGGRKGCPAALVKTFAGVAAGMTPYSSLPRLYVNVSDPKVAPKDKVSAECACVDACRAEKCVPPYSGFHCKPVEKASLTVEGQACDCPRLLATNVTSCLRDRQGYLTPDAILNITSKPCYQWDAGAVFGETLKTLIFDDPLINKSTGLLNKIKAFEDVIVMATPKIFRARVDLPERRVPTGPRPQLSNFRPAPLKMNLSQVSVGTTLARETSPSSPLPPIGVS
jgi:hypothetical protein